MKTFAMFLISLLLVGSVYAGSPTLSVKSKSKIKTQSFAVQFANAVNTQTGETLVLWSENGPVEAGFISPKGKLLGKAFVLVNDLMFGCWIAFNPSIQEYFITYTPFNRGIVPYGSIFGVRLDQHGKRIGKQFTVVQGVKPEKPNDLGDNSFPHVIFNPKTNGYVMVWERTEGITAALLDENGKLTSPIKIVYKNPGPNGHYDIQRPTDGGRIRDVQWLSSGKKLLVVFNQALSGEKPFGGNPSDDWLAVLDPLLKKPAKVSKINTDPLLDGSASLGVLPDGTACVFYSETGIVWERCINAKGKFSGQQFSALAPSGAPLSSPRVAFSTTATGTVGLLIAANGNSFGQTWAQTLDEHGRPAGQAKLVDDTLQTLVGIGTTLFALPGKSSDKVSQFIWMQARDVDAGGNLSNFTILKMRLQVTP